MQKKSKKSASWIGVVVAILILLELASMTVLFSRMVTYTQAKFANVLSLIDEPGTVTESVADPAAGTTSGTDTTVSDTEGFKKHPEFRMEAEVEIFKFTYDETGKITVIGPEGNEDKLIAPGTSNLYQFTLANPGDVALDYHLEMEAYVTGTDLWLPVNARVWDYTGKYLVGSPEEMPDVMELNTVSEDAELGAGRNAVYNLEWEWPFERPDENGDITENDIYDTMLGNLAVDEDLTLHIVIRTVAEYDETPDNPNAGVNTPPTGDETMTDFFLVLMALSFLGICVLLLYSRKSDRDDREQTERAK